MRATAALDSVSPSVGLLSGTPTEDCVYSGICGKIYNLLIGSSICACWDGCKLLDCT